MNDTLIVFSLGSLSVTAYAAILSVAVALALWGMHLLAKRAGLPADTALVYGLWALPLGLLGGRLLFVAFRWGTVVEELGFLQLFRLWDGGFALFGVVPGCVLAAVICKRRLLISATRIMDVAAPSAAFVLAIARFAELFTPQGVGLLVEEPTLQWFPLAVQNSYEEWVLPIFFFEGLAALVVAFLAFRALHSPKYRPFDAAACWLMGIGLTQAFLESMRFDDILRLGMVKPSQLTAMACVLGVALYWTVLSAKAGSPSRPILYRWVGIAVGIGICVGIEFGLDKSLIPNGILYAVMALSLAVIGILVRQLRPVPSPQS